MLGTISRLTISTICSVTSITATITRLDTYNQSKFYLSGGVESAYIKYLSTRLQNSVGVN